MTKVRILIVEDEKIVAMDLQNTLVNLGYDVPAIVTSGRDAIKNTEQIKPDLVLMDIVLKGDIDGIRAAAHIRHYFNIPVIYLTAYADKETLMRAKITEPFGYIIKPFEERELYTTIEMALYRHETETLLKKSEEKYKTLTENINVGIYRNTIGSKGKFIEVNPAFTEIFGYKNKKDFLKINVADLYQYPEDRGKFNEKMLKNGFVKNEELRLKKKDGTFFIGSVSAVAVRDEKGEVEYYDAVIEDITARKQAAQKLQYQADLLGNVSDAIISADLDYKIRTWNRAAEAMYGWKAGEVLGKNLYAIIKPEFLTDSSRNVLDKLSTNKFWLCEIIQQRKDGKKINVFESASVVKDSVGNSTGVVFVNRDVTELKRAEDELKKSEEKYRSIFELAPDGIITVDKKGIVRSCNTAISNISGFAKNELIGRHFSKLGFVRMRDIPKFIKIFSSILKGEPHDPFEVAWQHKDGTVRLAEIQVSLLKKDGEISGIQAIARDITRRKQAEESLVKSEAKYRSLAENTSVGVAITDLKGRFSYTNKALYELLGYTKEEMIGKSFTRFLHSDDKKRILQLFWNTFKNPKGALDLEFRAIHKNGWMVYLFANVTSFRYYGKIIGFHAIIQDITERKHAMHEIEKRLQMERVLAELSETLVKARKIDLAVNKALAALGQVFNVDHIYLFQVREKNKNWDCTHEWISKEVKARKRELQGVIFNQFNQWIKNLVRHRIITVSDMQKLPQGLRKDLKNFSKSRVKSFIAIPLHFEAKFFGVLILYNTKITRSWAQDDINILQAAGEIITSSLAKDRIQKKLTQTSKALDIERKRMVELAKRTIDMQEKERLYLASEIHDDLLQGLVAVLYFLQMIDVSSLDKKIQERKKKLGDIIKTSIERGRALISEIEPIREPEIGFVQAVKKSIDLRFAGTDVKIRFTHPPRIPRLDFATKANMLRIVQEALMNVRKHARTTTLAVKIAALKNRLKVEIKDDGIGFDQKSVTKRGRSHYGLLTMQERAYLIGGELMINSIPGKGTIIKGTFPLNNK